MKQKRWMKTVVETAKVDVPALPWHRGKARAAMIAKRSAPKTAKLARLA